MANHWNLLSIFKPRPQGVALIEVLLALAIIGTAGVLISSIPGLVALNTRSQHIAFAKELATKEVDFLRKKTYVNLINTTQPPPTFSDPDLNKLPALGRSATFQISDCPVNICPNPAEKAKRVKVVVVWNEAGKTQTVEMVTLVSSGGLAR